MDTLHSNYVRFSVLAVSSIFFLVDPFAAIPAFLAITAGADRQRQRHGGFDFPGRRLKLWDRGGQ